MRKPLMVYRYLDQNFVDFDQTRARKRTVQITVMGD